MRNRPLIRPMPADVAALLASLPVPDPAWFLRPDGHDASLHIHGVGHTRRVMAHAAEIATSLGTSKWERDAVIHAALWHDIGRTSDGGDYFHGGKSVGKVWGLGLHAGIDPSVLLAIFCAIEHHPAPDEYGLRAASRLRPADSAVRIFQILKDADGLDRVRFDNLDITQLRFEVSRARKARALEFLECVD